jgi:hypothetical protein
MIKQLQIYLKQRTRYFTQQLRNQWNSVEEDRHAVCSQYRSPEHGGQQLGAGPDGLVRGPPVGRLQRLPGSLADPDPEVPVL